MSDISPDSGAPVADEGFDAEFEGARAAELEGGDSGGDVAEIDPKTGEFVTAPKAEGDAPAEGADKAAAKAPLPADEVTKRWNDSKVALKAERAKTRQLQERMDALEAKMSAPVAPVAKADDQSPPDPEVDPVGAIKYWAEYAKKAQSADADFAKKQGETAQETKTRQALGQWAADQEADFSEDTPDYPEAYKHFVKTRQEELKEEGYKPGEVSAAFSSEMMALIKRCKQNDKSPAEAVYKLAQKRGYSLEKPVDKNSKALQQVERGQAANRSLSSGGRPQGSGVPLTIASVNGLKDGDAFDRGFAALRAVSRRNGG